MTAFLNRCIWTATAGGLGDFTVGAAALNGYTPTQCADPAVVDGGTYHYVAYNGTDHEEGDGVYSGGVLTRATIRNSSSAGAKVTFSAAPTVIMGGPVATDMAVIPAMSDMTFYVATTGSDTNPGTSGAPFATLQHAVNVAASYNWQNAYHPTISVADGTTYARVSLPNLLNCPNGGVITGNTTTPANVKINDGGADYAITSANFSTWTVNGVTTDGTYGSIETGEKSIFTWTKLRLQGSLSQYAIALGNGCFWYGIGQTLDVSLTAAKGLFMSRAVSVMDDGGVIAFNTAVTFSESVINLDSTLAFFAIVNAGITGAGNVTVSGTNPPLRMWFGAVFETNENTTVDGVELTRANFPGGNQNLDIDEYSTFMGDPELEISFAPSSGSNFIIPQGAKRALVIGFSGTIDEMTFTLPPNPCRNDRCVVTSNVQITNCSVVTSDGAFVDNPPTIMEAGSGFEFIYFGDGVDGWGVTVGPAQTPTAYAFGNGNIAVGPGANRKAQTGNDNIAIGGGALDAVTSGQQNFAMGSSALGNLTTGSNNFAFGFQSLYTLTTGGYNTAIGNFAQFSNIDGPGNVAVGLSALYNNQHGQNNVAIGNDALVSLNGGNYNVSIGAAGGSGVTSGSYNVVIGANDSGGGLGPTTGSRNILIGAGCNLANTTDDGQLCIGNFIYGTGMTGTGATVSTGKVGIGVKTPQAVLDVDGEIKSKVYAVAALPAAGIAGRKAFVSDANATTFASIVAGGGSNGVPVYDDGTNWRIG